ncbi:helix-turn-helix domain-containing protein [Candidatus Berkiella aquae]|uniref:LexA family transcriptional regulator n=1 Tax=Candidatus Berkiella aquae TaxID=295108 RepID=A0A0Q9YX74_9GAMM|nr:XRE family transcriptional regulator [Candidatus Berkiella aquae]MCS5710673.1 LexA family transcriptional regulator [Candidatus Berkiella aquae]
MKDALKRTPKEKAKQEVSFSSIIAKNLQHLSIRSGLSEAEIARRIDCPPQTLNRIFRGQTSDPKISIVSRLSQLFEVPISHLLSNDLTNDYGNYRVLPLLEWEELPDITHFNSLVSDKAKRSWQPVSIEVSENAFLLASKKSMYSRFPQGTFFVIDPNAQPQDGDIVIVHFRQNNIFSARELIIDAPEWKFNNLIDDTSSLCYQISEHVIIGVVLEKRYFQSR